MPCAGKWLAPSKAIHPAGNEAKADMTIKEWPDGLHFRDAGEMPNQSPGLLSSDVDADPKNLRGFEWGLEQYSEAGPRGLRRFDCSPKASNPTPIFPH
jgi:hypothetical protein